MGATKPDAGVAAVGQSAHTAIAAIGAKIVAEVHTHLHTKSDALSAKNVL